MFEVKPIFNDGTGEVSGETFHVGLLTSIQHRLNYDYGEFPVPGLVRLEIDRIHPPTG